MATKKLDAIKESKYIEGQESVYRILLAQCLSHLSGNEKTRSELILERNEAISTIKSLIEDCGQDADFDNDLHLSDIIEKHLYRAWRNSE